MMKMKRSITLVWLTLPLLGLAANTTSFTLNNYSSKPITLLYTSNTYTDIAITTPNLTNPCEDSISKAYPMNHSRYCNIEIPANGQFYMVYQWGYGTYHAPSFQISLRYQSDSPKKVNGSIVTYGAGVPIFEDAANYSEEFHNLHRPLTLSAGSASTTVSVDIGEPEDNQYVANVG
ncbi:hypothetical protein [Facilibium subflavum]|uniref:hypothetical protein n=1 Tax=Facilibium subflavum TaxID=2219058 RepID=UPI0013C335C6|nr:hypothetical protein [Facilibium subflavum]